MKISKVIANLTDMLVEHGDKDVVVCVTDDLTKTIYAFTEEICYSELRNGFVIIKGENWLNKLGKDKDD